MNVIRGFWQYENHLTDKEFKPSLIAIFEIHTKCNQSTLKMILDSVFQHECPQKNINLLHD